MTTMRRMLVSLNGPDPRSYDGAICELDERGAGRTASTEMSDMRFFATCRSSPRNFSGSKVLLSVPRILPASKYAYV